MILIQVDSSPEGEKNARGGSATSRIQNEGNQADGAILPPTPLIIPSTRVNEVEGVEGIGTTKSPINTEMTDIDEFNQSSDRPIALFSLQPYIPQENNM